MKIAVVSAFSELVPPKKYGGTELVVSNLTEKLVAMGHDVTLYAPKGSVTKAKLVPVLSSDLRSMKLKTDRHGNALVVYAVGKLAAMLKKEKFDIIHNHIGWRLLSVEELIGSPIITTLHGPLHDEYMQFAYGLFKDANYVSISLNQRKGFPTMNFVANVYNGLDMDKFKFFPKPSGNYFAFLGRMSPEKGPVQAIDAAKKAGVNLVMAAKVDGVDNQFFEKEVKPKIDGKQIKFLGEVDHAGKLKLLGNARGLIAPIQWEEPFGLFLVEALACGTPVITMKRGSVPELINPKVGFACTTQQEVVDAIGKIDTIDRKTCFDHASKNFSSTKMTQDYLAAYKKIAKKKSWFGL